MFDPPTDPVSLAFPVADRALITDVVGVDHDPTDHGSDRLGQAMCVDHAGDGFPACYDEHDGSDFLLAGGFDTMDAGSVDVIAAADGVVVLARDGHYDRCRATLEGVDCNGEDGIANAVTLDHGDGVVTRYWHLQRDSVAVVQGQTLTEGTVLGRIGSSGYSSLPHLHFELQVDEAVVDPYAGPFSQERSWWCVQDAGDGLPGACD